MWHAPPCNQRLGDNTPCHADAWPVFNSFMQSYAILRSWTWFAPRLVTAVTCLLLCSRFHKIAIVQAVLQSDWWTGLCHDLLPLKWADQHLIGMLSAQSHPPLKLTLGAPTLSPEHWVPSKTHACAEIAQHSHHHYVNQLGECHLELKETLEGQELPGGNTWGMRTSRGIAVISYDAHLIGGHKLAVWPLDATVCFIWLF